MNKFYRKPKPETIQKNKEFNKKNLLDEIKWLEENYDHTFVVDHDDPWMETFQAMHDAGVCKLIVQEEGPGMEGTAMRICMWADEWLRERTRGRVEGSGGRTGDAGACSQLWPVIESNRIGPTFIFLKMGTWDRILEASRFQLSDDYLMNRTLVNYF